MTQSERVFAYHGPMYRCCVCRHDGLTRGPRGGASTNMACAKCGAVFNLIDPEYRDMYGDGVTFFGQVVKEPSVGGTAAG